MSSTKWIIGIDEVGRGALAGPIVVTAFLLPKKVRLVSKHLPPLKDSKKLSALQRERWFSFFGENEKIRYATSRVAPRVVDRINITEAANRAATRAYKKLVIAHNVHLKNGCVRLDGGLFLNNISGISSKTIIKGDEKITAIKCASIIAKVTRDRYMVRLHKEYPQYDFHIHKGYGTKRHRNNISRNGSSKAHRKTFLKNIYFS